MRTSCAAEELELCCLHGLRRGGPKIVQTRRHSTRFSTWQALCTVMCDLGSSSSPRSTVARVFFLSPYEMFGIWFCSNARCIRVRFSAVPHVRPSFFIRVEPSVRRRGMFSEVALWGCFGLSMAFKAFKTFKHAWSYHMHTILALETSPISHDQLGEAVAITVFVLSGSLRQLASLSKGSIPC